MLTKYKVHHLRNDVLRSLSASWPTTLTKWDAREASVTANDTPLPHPMLAEFTISLLNVDHPFQLAEKSSDLLVKSTTRHFCHPQCTIYPVPLQVRLRLVSYHQ